MRIFIISDIHANLTAFQSVLADAKGQWEYVWCLGDVVGVWWRPERMRRPAPHHAALVLGRQPRLGLRRAEFNRTFNPDARKAVNWTRETLTADNISYLDALPTTFVIGNYTLANGNPRETCLGISLEPLIAALNFPHFETPYCLVGHTHQPVVYQQVGDNGETEAYAPAYRQPRRLNGKRQIINPGSVGQPRDLKPRLGLRHFGC